MTTPLQISTINKMFNNAWSSLEAASKAGKLSKTGGAPAIISSSRNSMSTIDDPLPGDWVTEEKNLSKD